MIKQIKENAVQFGDAFCSDLAWNGTPVVVDQNILLNLNYFITIHSLQLTETILIAYLPFGY